MAAVGARSSATRLLQLHSVSNGPSGQPAAPTAEFIIVVSNVAASHCFEWTEWEPAAPTAEFIIVVSNVPASHCFEWTEWEPAAPTAEFIIVVSNVPASQCFEWTKCIT